MKIFNTLADLQAARFASTGQLVQVKGTDTTGDGGIDFFLIQNSGTPDGVDVFATAGSKVAVRQKGAKASLLAGRAKFTDTTQFATGTTTEGVVANDATWLSLVGTTTTVETQGFHSGSTVGGAKYKFLNGADSAAAGYVDGSSRFQIRGLDVYACLVVDIWLDVTQVGADPKGVTLSTQNFETARDLSSFIFVPSGTFWVENFSWGNRKHYLGYGTRQNGSTLISKTLNTPISSFTNLAETTIDGLNFDATEEGVTALYQTSFAQYFQNSTIKNCVFFRSLRYGIYANLIANEINRCNFFQHGSALGSQDITAIHAQWNGSSNTVNINRVVGCNIYNTKGEAVRIIRGFQFIFEQVIFEAIDGWAGVFDGVDGVEFKNCWFENIDNADGAFDANLSTVGTRISMQDCKVDNNNGLNPFTQLVSLDPACTLSYDNIHGNMNGAYFTVKAGRFDNGIKKALNCNVVNYTGFNQDSLYANRVIARGQNEQFAIRKTGLSDSPVSPENVVTFHIPTAPSGQNSFMATIFCEAFVSAVATTTSNKVQNRQKLEIVIFVDSGGVAASISTSDSTSNSDGSGTWSSEPAWSVNVSSQDVELLMTSNPTGGDFTSGIKSVVSGYINNCDVAGLGTIIDYT